MGTPDIESALIQTFREAVTNDAIVAYPNRVFTPPDSGLWYSVANNFVEGIVRTLGDQGDDEQTGYFQVIVNAQINTGTKDLNAAREMLRKKFKLGSRVSYNGQVVRITLTRTPPLIPNGAYESAVFQAYWSAAISRSN